MCHNVAQHSNNSHASTGDQAGSKRVVWLVWSGGSNELFFCSVDKILVKEEYYGSFSCDDGTRLYPESARTGNLSKDDRTNIEKSYGKKKGKIPPPSSQGIPSRGLGLGGFARTP